jgi:hypothetical protein
MNTNVNLMGNHDHIDSPTIITPWTISHFLAGWLAFLVLRLFFPYESNLRLAILWLILHSVYEFKDYYVTYSMQIKYTNTFINTISDTIFTMIGFYVGVIVGYSTITMFNVGLLLCIFLLISTNHSLI